jgi:hypothetical protein
MSPADEDAAGISASGDEGTALQRAQDKIATMQARAGAPDELPQSGVLEDVGSDTGDIQQELDEAGSPGDMGEDLTALRAEIGPGSPAPLELAGSRGPGASAGARHPPPARCRELHPAGSSGGTQISQICVATGMGRSRRLKVQIGGYLRCAQLMVNYTALGEASPAAAPRCACASIACGVRRRLG